MSVKCGYCKGYHASAQEVKACGLKPPITSIEQVNDLLGRPAPSFESLLEAMAVCRGAANDQLLDRCIQLALASVTGEVPEFQWKPVVREAAARLLASASYGTLVGDSERIAGELRGLGSTYTPRVAEALDQEARTLDEIALLLSNGEAASLVSACSNLRKMGRPDLGEMAATQALAIDSESWAGLTTRAAARLDQGLTDSAKADVDRVEVNSPSLFSANVLSRAAAMAGNHEEAERWAYEANERDPEGVAGMLTLVGVAAVRGDYDRVRWALKQYNAKSGRQTSENWTLVLAAKDLLRSGHDSKALAILERLAESGYGPAERELLQYRIAKGDSGW